MQPDSVQTIQDALAQITQLHPVQVGQSSSSEASRQVLLEALPPVLVLHFERFVYDADANCINKVNKAVQFGSELGIPPGMILSSPSPRAGQAKNPSFLSRNHGTHCREVIASSSLQALWGALPPR